jgi:hypothetical protein
VDIVDWSASWSDGLGFAALIHCFHPESIDFDSLSKCNPKQVLQTVFQVAEKVN